MTLHKLMQSRILWKIKQYSNENGIPKTCFWFAGKTVKLLLFSVIQLKKSYVLERDISGNMPSIKAKMDVTYKFADFKDMESFQGTLRPWRKWSQIFKARFERGQVCIVCLNGNKAIGYVWVSFVPEKDKELGLEINPGEDGSYGFDLFVPPEYRKFLIGYELISRWLKYSRDAGKSKAVGMVMKTNKPMLATSKLEFGLKVRREVHSLEFLRWRGLIISDRMVG